MTDAPQDRFFELEESVQLDLRSWLRIPLKVALAAVVIVPAGGCLVLLDCPAALAKFFVLCSMFGGLALAQWAGEKLIPLRAGRKVLLNEDEIRLTSADGSESRYPNRDAIMQASANPNDLDITIGGRSVVLPRYVDMRREQWASIRQSLGITSGFLCLAVEQGRIVVADSKYRQALPSLRKPIPEP